MKRYFNQILMLSLLGAVVLTSCRSNSDDFPTSDRAQIFTFELEQYDNDKSPTSASRAAGEITQLIAGIYDAQGALLNNVTIIQSSDLRQMSIEGLQDGQYTVVFIGVGEQRSADKPTLQLPERIEGAWLTSAGDNEYLYAKNTFTIANGEGVSASVGLKRAVGIINIEPNFTDGQWTKGSIQSLKIMLDDATVYTTHNADNTYGGAGGVLSTDISQTFSLYTMPTVGTEKRNGSLLITGVQGDGTPYTVFYEFDLMVEANKRAVIRPSYKLDADQFGTVRVYDLDRSVKNSKLMFQDPKDGTHHYTEIASHTFSVNNLLKLTFSNSTLTARFYSHIAVKDVTVYVRRANDAEFFEVAWFESIGALEERRISLSASPHNRLYRTESGNAVFIDRMTNDLEYKYVSSDLHMQKLASINWPFRISFIQPTADTTKSVATKLPFRAVHAREAVALWANLGYVYSHPKWTEMMFAEEAKGPFLENGTSIPINAVFMPKVFNKMSTNFAVLNILNSGDESVLGLASIGSGAHLGLRGSKVYAGHYMDQDNIWHFYTTPAHEYHHTLGYTHVGDFTYGKNTKVITDCYQALAAELPYPSSKLLKSKSNPNHYKGIP